jgi:alcohol dehydrogenase (NADP+)
LVLNLILYLCTLFCLSILSHFVKPCQFLSLRVFQPSIPYYVHRSLSTFSTNLLSTYLRPPPILSYPDSRPYLPKLGWAPANYPVCVGHEIVGTAIRVGKSITHIKPGSRVGVGAQSDSCLKPDCEQCTTSNEHYCQRLNTSTYNSKYATGEKSNGGYATHWRGPGHFVFAIPDALPSAVAAPMLCGGITVYSPLVRNGAGPGKRVGIIGIGGLGHFGILFAKALDCDYIVGISRKNDKRADALAMGAHAYIATDDDKNWNRTHRQSLDLIVCTVSSPNMPLTKYFQLLRVGGTFIQVGAPEDVIPAFSAFSLMSRGVKFGGSMIGSPAEIREMLDLAAAKNVRSWVQERGMGDANGAVVDMDAGKARYRYVLVNEEEKTARL